MKSKRTIAGAEHAITVTGIQKLLDRVALVLITLKIWYYKSYSDQSELIIIIISIMFGLIVIERLGGYRSSRTKSLYKLGRSIMLRWIVSCFIYASLVHIVLGSHHGIRESIIEWSIGIAGVLFINHIGLRLYIRRKRASGSDKKKLVYCGNHDGKLKLEHLIKSRAWLGLKIIAYFVVEDNDGGRVSNTDSKEYRAKIKDIGDWLENNTVDIIIFSDFGNNDDMKYLLRVIGDTCSSVLYMPAWQDESMILERSSFGGIECMEVWGKEKDKMEEGLKRACDIFFGAIAFALLLPLLAIVAIAIKLQDGGSVIFRQERYGLDGRSFWIYKFRTMREEGSNAELIQVTVDDSRVTRVGRFLRRTSIDELPQLVNIIKGEMSFIGPRPHAKQHNELYRKKFSGYMQRHFCRPGLTGLAQIDGLRGETDTDEKMERRVRKDLEYIREWNLWLDAKILFKTFVSLMRYKAY